MLELLLDSSSAGCFENEKTFQRACEKILRRWMSREVRIWIKSSDLGLKGNDPKPKHRHSLSKWKSSHPFWRVSRDILVPLPSLKETSAFCL